MKSIGIIGASGFLGGALAKKFELDSWRVVRISRSIREVEGQEWRQLGEHAFVELDAVVNLAGERIDQRWSDANKKRFYESRVALTGQIADWISNMPLEKGRPKVWLNASAVGVYGDRGDEELTEGVSNGEGYLARLCADWENAAHDIPIDSCRIIHTRVGVVLGEQSMAWNKMLKIFSCGLGGKLAGGTQWFPWVHVDDVVAAMAFLINEERATGVFNTVAPNSVTNAEFTRLLGNLLGRPTVCAVPRFVLRCLLGEFATALLASQRVRPEKLENLGFCWAYPNLKTALESLKS